VFREKGRQGEDLYPFSIDLLSIEISSRHCYRKSSHEHFMTTVTISLPDSLKAFIDQQLETKGYGNVSEYFRTLLRAAQEREEEARLEALLVEGLISGGDDIPLTREFWKELKVEAMDLARKHQGRKNRS
jgi:antitoxin ParD1/3/4